MLVVAALLGLAGPVTGDWTLRDGSRVSVVLIQGGHKRAWQLDGTPLDGEGALQRLDSFGILRDMKETAIVIVVTGSKLKNQFPSFRINIPTYLTGDSSMSGFTVDKKGGFGVFNLRNISLKRHDLEIGVTSGTWATRGWMEYSKPKAGSLPTISGGVKLSVEVGKTPPWEHKNAAAKTSRNETFTVRVQPVKGLESYAVRFVAFNRTGRELLQAGSAKMPYSNGATDYWFMGRLSDLARFEVQTRSFEWHKIPDVHLQPN